jgi:hypothetical protein
LRDTVAVDEPEAHIELTGETRTDLIAMLTHMADRVGRRRGARMMAVAIERSGHRGQAGGPHREMFRRRMEPLRKIIESGVEKGVIKSGVDTDDAVAQLAGPAFFQTIFMRREIAPDFITTVVDSFLAANRK